MNFLDRLNCQVPPDWMNDFSQCLYEWQGLVGAVLALMAATISIIVLQSQITQGERHETQRLRRQHDAARATLPLTLSGLVASIRLMLLELNQASSQVKFTSVVGKFEIPPVPTNRISELQSIIATTDDRTVTEPVSEVIRQIQTLWVRVDVLADPHQQQTRSGLDRNIEDWIIQAAQIHAIVESLFDYARSETAHGPSAVPWSRAEHVLFQLGIETAERVNHVKLALEKSKHFWTLRD